MSHTPSVVKITDDYETWMRALLPFVQEQHLQSKYQQMAKSGKSGVFRFFRGTFYPWAQRVREALPALMDGDAPIVLGVGDIHLENFGTWRDGEGRLVWGVNDIDEATTMPYTQDLVRLATSAALSDLRIDASSAAAAILAGYRSQLTQGGRAFVVAEADRDLWHLARKQTADPYDWWEEHQKLHKVTQGADIRAAQVLLESSFPDPQVSGVEWGTREAGMGSLGRPRIVAVGYWYGSRICREAKSVLPSAWDWSTGHGEPAVPAGSLFDSPYRAADPYARVVDQWSIRRVAPDSDKIAIDKLTSTSNQHHLLEAMGRELGNIHLASTDASVILHHLPRTDEWLLDATNTMGKIVTHDQQGYAAARERR